VCPSVQTRRGDCVNAAAIKENLLAHDSGSTPPANRLLGRLARQERVRFLADCETVEVKSGQVLMGPGMRITHAWFPLDAVLSLGIAAGRKPDVLEVALVGREGMVGIPLLLGSTVSSLRATVVRPGALLRIAVAPLRAHLRASEAVRQSLQQYVLVALAQLAQAALCTRYHRVEGRLARWLLMTQDRAPPGPVHATHELLAATLGVRRAGVTQAAASLQGRELIAYHRGELTVLDRQGLLAVACSCYAADCASYTQGMRRIAAE
jgi:CRP-like cAMP-binding protein